MTDPQKKKSWNELAEKIGVASSPETTPATPPTPAQPVASATPPPPPKRPPAPVKKSGWGTIASFLGIETSPPVETPPVEAPPSETPRVETPRVETPRVETVRGDVFQNAPPASAVPANTKTSAWPAKPARQETASQPEADVARVEARGSESVVEPLSPATEFHGVDNDSVEETGVASRGSSRGRRRGGARPPWDDVADDVGAPGGEPAARISPPESTEPKGDFSNDDDDPLLLPQDTFVDEIDVSFDDLPDSIDNAEVVPSAGQVEERPKRRRRRGRRRGRRDGEPSEATEVNSRATEADEETVDELFDRHELGSELPATGRDAEASEGGDGVAREAGDETSESAERGSRKRRRGRRRRGGKRDEPAGRDASNAEKQPQTAPHVASPGSPGDDDELDDDDDDDVIVDNRARDGEDDDEGDGDDENGDLETRHRKIPTWSDAIGGIVDNNLATRSKNPNPPRRGRGGRGRQGDRPRS